MQPPGITKVVLSFTTTTAELKRYEWLKHDITSFRRNIRIFCWSRRAMEVGLWNSSPRMNLTNQEARSNQNSVVCGEFTCQYIGEGKPKPQRDFTDIVHRRKFLRKYRNLARCDGVSSCPEKATLRTAIV